MRRIIKNIINLQKVNTSSASLGSKLTANYWTEHNVTSHHIFKNANESLDYFDWRNDQYFRYIDLMPVSGQDGKTVLDFGCGPGHDLIGFGIYSKPSRLVGVDISGSSLEQSRSRLKLHQINADLIKLSPQDVALPFSDQCFDYIHSSGVLHHTPDPVSILLELRRILKPRGELRIMVYNRNSLWMHLYVAYQRNILEGLFPNENLDSQFRRSTDGENCPISNCYTPEEWLYICKTAGFRAKFLGAAVSIHEMSLLHLRFAAIQDRRLPRESRKFLNKLQFDFNGYPMIDNYHAGIDACYLLNIEE